jgi:hypothetical protein
VLDPQCFHIVEAFEIDLLKVSALKLSYTPTTCPVFQNFSHLSLAQHGLSGEGGRVRGHNVRRKFLDLTM